MKTIKKVAIFSFFWTSLIFLFFSLLVFLRPLESEKLISFNFVIQLLFVVTLMSWAPLLLLAKLIPGVDRIPPVLPWPFSFLYSFLLSWISITIFFLFLFYATRLIIKAILFAATRFKK